jgi:hypothetical protein
MANDLKESARTAPPIEDEASTLKLRKASDELKVRIAKAKGRSDMPFDSTLGNPTWDRDAADGHLDVPDDEDDGWPRMPAKPDKTSPP